MREGLRRLKKNHTDDENPTKVVFISFLKYILLERQREMTYVASEKKNIFERDEISLKEIVAVLRAIDKVFKMIWREESIELVDYQGKKIVMKKFNLENDLVKNLVNINIEKIRLPSFIPDEKGPIIYIIDIHYGKYIIEIEMIPTEYQITPTKIEIFDQADKKRPIAGRRIDQIYINWSEINK